MTTGVQLALLGGSLISLGLVLLLYRVLPADPDVVDVVYRYSPEGFRRTRTTHTLAASTGTFERLGLWAIRRFPSRWWGPTPRRELAILRIPIHRHYGKKVLYGLVGLVCAPVLSYLLAALGFPIPILVPVLGSVALAVGLFLTPDIDVRSDARHARAEFARALGAYTDLVALERLVGSAPRQAMELAASVGDSWVFRRLAEELNRSRWAGQAPWDALHILADDLGVPDLDDLANVMRLAEDGSELYTNLRARSSALRAAMLSEELARANAAGERLSMPMSLLGVVFMAILVLPPLLRVMLPGAG